jgi:hypothetical protein
MTYRQEVERIYQNLNKLAKDGDLAIQDYYQYIDDLIDEGKYQMLSDVLITKYKIDLGEFWSIQDFKKNSFKKIKNKTISNTQIELNELFKEKSVYCMGKHFYNSTNYRYLGDIVEVNPEYQSGLYLLDVRPWQSLETNLNVVRGSSSSIFDSVPRFGDISGESFFYVTQSQVSYQNNVYECILSFTWSKTNEITPTYSSYFTQSKIPNFSFIEIKDGSKSLLQKYSLAIDILKL